MVSFSITTLVIFIEIKTSGRNNLYLTRRVKQYDDVLRNCIGNLSLKEIKQPILVNITGTSDVKTRLRLKIIYKAYYRLVVDYFFFDDFFTKILLIKFLI